MSIPLFFPPPIFIKQLACRAPLPLDQLCEKAGVKCLASGAWTKREVEIIRGDSLQIVAQAGDWGAVRIAMPADTEQAQARLALAAMAYAMHDLVAKQSIAKASWAAIAAPRGRPRKKRALSNKERQRLFRKKRATR